MWLNTLKFQNAQHCSFIWSKDALDGARDAWEAHTIQKKDNNKKNKSKRQQAVIIDLFFPC